MSDINVNTANGACRIELNRPDCGNLVTTDMVGELTQALASLAADVKLAPSMPAAARGGFGASLFAGALSSR
jgi:enoyl-CoA hydratase/carnithine racemase